MSTYHGRMLDMGIVLAFVGQSVLVGLRARRRASRHLAAFAFPVTEPERLTRFPRRVRPPAGGGRRLRPIAVRVVQAPITASGWYEL